MEQRERSTYQRILDAAEKLFAEKGYKETTTREIVREAGASLSSLQAHFQGKENVYYRVRSRSIDKLAELMKPSMDEVEYLDRQGLLYGEMAWNLLSEVVSKYAAWCFAFENRHTIMLISRELMEGVPVPDFPEEQSEPFFSVIQLLCMRYTGTEEADWSMLLGRILLLSMLSMSVDSYRRNQTGSDHFRLSLPMEEVMYQAKSYLLLTLRAYLDVRRDRAQESGAQAQSQIQPNQGE